MLSYAGVELVYPSVDLVEEIQKQISPSWLCEAAQRVQPLMNLGSLDWHGLMPSGPLRIGVFEWPLGAARFGSAFYLVDQAGADYLRKNASGAEALIIDDGRKSVTAQMSMLPLRPLFQANKTTPALYLLSLVDQRFFWWFRAASISLEATWADLYASIAAALDITIAVDAVDSAYGVPTVEFVLDYGPLPFLLDAVATQVGQRLVCSYDGTVRAMSAASSNSIFQNNLVLAPRLAGNVLDLSVEPSQANDLDLVLPESFTVLFPRTNDGTRINTGWPVTVTLSSLGLPEFSGITGFAGSKVFRGYTIATFTGGGLTPTNESDLQAFANQAASDYYHYQAAGVDAVYEGAVAWQPEGQTESILIEHGDGFIRTRAQRGPWLDHAGEQPDFITTGGGGSITTDLTNLTLTVNNTTFNVTNSSSYVISTSQFLNFYGPGYVVFYAGVKFKGALWYDYETRNLDGTVPLLAATAKVVLRLNPSASTSLYGIVPTPDSGSGQVVELTNVNNLNTIFLINESGGTLASNTFHLPQNMDMILRPWEGVNLWYDPADLRWKAIDRQETARFTGAKWDCLSGVDLSNATWTPIPLTHADLDMDPSLHDPINTTRLNVPVTGYYMIGGEGNFKIANDFARQLRVRIKVNGLGDALVEHDGLHLILKPGVIEG